MAIMRTKLTLANSASQISRLVMYRMVLTILVCWMVSAIFRASAGVTNGVLTTTAEIRSLTVEQAAKKIPILVTGVVTVAEPTWKGKFFVQDPTGGVFVENTNNSYPVPGDLIQVSGVSNPGGYTPDIVLSHWNKFGKVPLPKAKPVSIVQLTSGAEDGDRVEVYGVVKSAKSEGPRLSLELESGGYRFLAFPPYSTNVSPDFLVGTTVRVTGTAATSYDAHRHFLTAAIFMPREPEVPDFIVDPFQSTTATNNILTTAAEILSLTTEQAAKAIPVSITGVVTVAEPNWGGNFFVQDSTGGAFVNNGVEPQPGLGEVVRVDGYSHPGSFAPDINAAYWTKLGTAPLPRAVPISAEQFMSGAADGQRIELSGVVIRSAQQSQIVKTRLRLELESGGYRFRAFPPLPRGLDPDSLAGATVRLRGTAAVSFNTSLRNMRTVVMFVPQWSDFIVDRLPDPAIADAPLASLNRIAQYRRSNFSDPRIRVRGIVTYQRPGIDIFLHDETGGLQVECHETNIIAPGEIVEAIGFPGIEGFLPILEDATVIRTSESEQPLVPQAVSIQELYIGIHHADLISLQGKLLDRSLRSPISANSSTNTDEENVLTLKSDRDFFTVEAPATGPFAGLADIPIGSTLEVSGVCLLQADKDGEIETVQIVPIHAADIRILQQPGWWTPQRLLVALGILLIVSLVGIAWTLMIHRKNAVLKLSITETIKAQEELQKAHDELETRVEERTREWKFETGARKEAEIQYKAILSERTRLAQELHDTLLQGFTGVGLKLDAVTSNLPPSLAATKEQIQKILKQSDEYLSEARRAVWQLRSPSLQAPEDFSEALKKVSERALQGTRISLRFTTCGTESKLEPGIEDDFLRICEEAVTNAVRHANPTEVEVMLEYTANELRLRVRDNGRGFDPNGSDSAKDGHFGLIGIRERTKRLAGNLSLNSQPGQGTEILVIVSSSPKS
jgi:signal transduction histidine kinase